MGILGLVKDRRSIRKFKKKTVSKQIVEKILEVGRWAPSGLNNQPWRFMVLAGAEKEALAQFTHYRNIIKGANKVILVFLDKKASYNYEKDLMAIGACIQNMLLSIHSLGLGACWLGEILNQRSRLQKSLKLPRHLQLEAAVALGYPVTSARKGRRKPLKSLLLRKNI